jgi:RimJ/RimL family protein N-acetyltransferase
MAEVQLRPVTEGDLPILFEHQRDPVANRMAAFAGRDWEPFVEHWSKILVDDSLTHFAILFAGEVVGNIVSFERGGVREVGYWIGRQHWGKGIATAALKRFLALSSERPLYAHVAKDNLGSIKVLDRCGFAVIGYETSPADERWDAIEEVVMRLDPVVPRDDLSRRL